MAEPPPGFFARICCCSREEKEPPVTLIRSNDLPAPVEQTTITPATETMDGLEDQPFETANDEKGPKEEFRGKAPKWKSEQKPETILEESKELDGMNLNDLMMNDICGNEEDKPALEDAVSIRTNVIEEVDESELRQMSEILKKDVQLKDGKEEPQTSSRSAEVVTLQQILLEGYDSPRAAINEETPAIEITPAVEDGRAVEEEELQEIEEMQKIANSRPSQDESDDELEEEIIIHETTESTAPTASPRSILKTSPSNPSTARTDESVNSSRREEDSDEDEAPPIPALPPPEYEPLEGLHHAVLVNVEDEPKKTLMYADADSSSDDDEAEREVLPPVAKPEDDKTDVEDEEGWEEKSEKENQVTRLSVKSNGQATMTTGGVRVALEAVEITDDEFSEKLI